MRLSRDKANKVAHVVTDALATIDELDLVHFLEDVGDSARQHVHFVAAQSHSTALYLRTSSVFTLRNIS